MATKITYPDKVTWNEGDPKTEFNTFSAPDANEIKTSVNGNIDDVEAHVADVSNPHGVTKSQVGLSSVDNTSDAAKPVSTAQSTALGLKVDKTTTVNGHALSGNVTVSKADVGLGNADNTSDANKPISAAEQSVMDAGAVYSTVSFPIYATTGTVKINGEFEPSANWKSTLMNPVYPGMKVDYNGIRPFEAGTATKAALIGFDEYGKNPIILISNTVGTVNAGQYIATITIPDNVFYISGSGQGLTGNVFTLTTYNASFFKPISAPIKHDGRFIIIGDSIVANDGLQIVGTNQEFNYGYGTWIKRSIAFVGTVPGNYGYSGFSFAAGVPGAPVENSCIIRRKTDWVMGNTAKQNVCVLACLTNDFKLNRLIGTTSDYLNNTGDTTLYGSFRIFFDYIYSISPLAQILLVGPAQRDNGGYNSWFVNTAGFTLSDYDAAMKWAAEYNGVGYVSLFKEGGINLYNVNSFTVDGLHPQNLGYARLSKPIVSTLIKMLKQ